MRNVLILSKVYLKNTLNGIVGGSTSSRGSFGKITKYLIVALPLLLLPSVITMSKLAYDGFNDMGIPQAALTQIYTVTVVIMLYTVLAQLIASLKGDKMLSQIMCQPVTARQVYLAKVFNFYLFNLLETLYITTPMLVIYSLDHGFGAFATGILAALILPVVPICAALIIVLPIAKLITNTVLGKIIPFVLNALFIVAYLFLLRKFSNPQAYFTPEYAANIDAVISRAYPPAKWASDFTFMRLPGALYYLALSAVTAAVTIFTTGFFAKILISEGESQKATKKVDLGLGSPLVFSNESISASKGRTLGSLLKRQNAILFSSGQFIMQCVGTVFVLPILIIVMAFTGEMSGDQFLTVFKSLKASGLSQFAVVLFMAAPVAASSIGMSSIAREGASFWENKVMPISAKFQVASRLIYTLIWTLPLGLIFGIIASVLTGATPLEIVLGLLGGIGYILAFSAFDHLEDLKRPNLNWTTHVQAVKNSAPIMIAMFSKLIFTFLFFGGCFLLSKKLKVTTVAMIASLFGIFAGALMTALLLTRGIKYYNRIDA